MTDFDIIDTFVQHLPNSYYGIEPDNLHPSLSILSKAFKYLNLAFHNLPTNQHPNNIKAIMVPNDPLPLSGIGLASAYSPLLYSSFDHIVILAARSSGKSGLLIPDLDYFMYGGLRYNIDNQLHSEFIQTDGVDLINSNEFLEESSIEIQMPFIHLTFNASKIKILPILVGTLTDKSVLELAEILVKLDSRKTLWVLSTNLMNIKSDINKNLTSKIIKSESDYAKRFLRPTTKKSRLRSTSLELMEMYRDHRPKINGFCVISLWTEINYLLNNKLVGKITSYYTNQHINRLNLITDDNTINMKDMFHRFDEPDKDKENVRSISYLSVIYVHEDKLLSSPYRYLLTHYEKYALLDLIHRIIENVIDNNYRHRTKTAWATPPPFISGVYLLPIPCCLRIINYIDFVDDKSTRGYLGSLKTQNSLYASIVNYTLDAGFKKTFTTQITQKELGNLIIELGFIETPIEINVKKNNFVLNGVICHDIYDVDDDNDDVMSNILPEWNIGYDGLLLNYRKKNTIFLPQIPNIYKWNRKETLQKICERAKLSEHQWMAIDVKTFKFYVYSFNSRMYGLTSFS